MEVDLHTTLEAAGRPIVFLIRVGMATCSRSMDSGGVDVDSHTTLEQGTLAGKGGVDIDSHTTLEQGKIVKIVPQDLLKTLQTVGFLVAKSSKSFPKLCLRRSRLSIFDRRILKIVPQALLKTLQTVDSLKANS